MEHEDRLRRIVELVEASGAVTVSQLVTAVGASEATLRRDLTDLDARGLLRRVHGGARRAELRGDEASYAFRASTNPGGKQRIARAVADILTPGEAVVLDSGTTAVAIAHAVADLSLRVVPLSLPAADALAASPRISVTMPGGELRHGEGSFTGPMVENALRTLRFDTAVISPCGVSLRTGVTAYDPGDAAVKRAAMESAARRILVCDESKWDATAFAAFAELTDFDLVVTDRQLTADEADYFADRDIRVTPA